MFLVEKRPDGAVVSRRLDESLDREPLAQLQRRLAVIIAHCLKHRVVIGGIDHHGHGLVILGGAADHRRTADVDILNRFGQRHVRFRDGGFERIEVYHHEIDRFETALARFGFVFRIAALVKQAAMHARMQSFHATFENFWKRGETGNLPHRHVFFAQKFSSPASRNNIDALPFKGASKLRDTGLIGDGDEGTGDFHRGLEKFNRGLRR